MYSIRFKIRDVTTLSADDREMVHQLLEDVKLLQASFTHGLPRGSALRATFVPILRKWIVEAGFFKVTKLIQPHQPSFLIRKTPDFVKNYKSDNQVSWMAQLRFGDIGFGIGSQTPVKTPQRASEFFRQTMFFWKGTLYTRKDVLQFYANRLGGVHLDPRRAADEEYINEIKNYFGIEVKPETNQIMLGEEIELARADPGRRNCIYDATELVAMDTGRIFAEGVLASLRIFEAALRA